MGKLKILNSTGDQETTWENATDANRLVAEQLFADAIKKGHTGYLMDEDKIGHKVDKLPLEGEVVMAPRLVGG